MSHHEARTTLTMEEATIPAGHKLARFPKIAAAVGVVGLGASFAIGMGDDHLYYSYLTNFMFWLSIALGGLWFTLIQHAVRAGWSIVVRRLAENLMITLPVFALLFIPIVLGLGDLYHWVHPGDDPILAGKAAFLNTPAFLTRAGVFLVLWSALAFFFYRTSTRQDAGGAHELTHRLRAAAPVGIVITALTSTFAAVDWMMSLDPHWFSTIFGVYYFAGSIIAIHATLAIVCMWLQRQGLLRDVITSEHYHDLGKMVFAFVVFWAYIGFSQYFLIWYANLPEETLWYQVRAEGSWETIGIILMVCHFAIPFLYLIGRTVKRIRITLLLGAIWMLIMHWIDLFYIIQPVMTHHHGHEGATFHVLDVTTFLGIGGIVLAVFGWRLAQRPMVPTGDPRLAESLAFENV